VQAGAEAEEVPPQDSSGGGTRHPRLMRSHAMLARPTHRTNKPQTGRAAAESAAGSGGAASGGSATTTSREQTAAAAGGGAAGAPGGKRIGTAAGATGVCVLPHCVVDRCTSSVGGSTSGVERRSQDCTTRNGAAADSLPVPPLPQGRARARP
jgi:hypothetical protein